MMKVRPRQIQMRSGLARIVIKHLIPKMVCYIMNVSIAKKRSPLKILQNRKNVSVAVEPDTQHQNATLKDTSKDIICHSNFYFMFSTKMRLFGPLKIYRY